ncbi:MAG: fibronectin type III domain-containing protein, partial [Flavobacterium sp.]
MKKLYTFALAIGVFHCVQAQVLHQSAGWPDASWSITGTYSNDPLAFESSPVTTENFAFDDDDAGSGGHEDNIAAESPIIDLTAAFNANEKKLEITVDYGYRYLADDALLFQYWNADTSAWVAWPGGLIPGNSTSVNDNFCTIPKTTYISSALDISAFTATQLSGFRYRISYDDNPAGADWNYGFCFSSPTIQSVGCESPSALAVAGITSSAANVSWAPIAGIQGFEYVLDNSAATPATGIATTATSYSATGLNASTLYYFHIRTNCGGTYSPWRAIQFTTPAAPPANDSCSSAIAITAFPYSNAQDAVAATNNSGFISVCSGMNDGVWYTFTGNGGDITLTVQNVGSWDPELGVFTGSCGTFTCVGQRDSAGTGGNET